MKNRNLNHSNDWATPDYILDEIREEFGEFFDPCPFHNDIKLWDGLKSDWNGRVHYINPPYERKLKEAFIRKAFEESKKGKTCIMLLPVSTSTKIFHEIIYPNAEIRFIKRRIKFKGINTKGEYVDDKAPMHDSMFVIFTSHKTVEVNKE